MDDWGVHAHAVRKAVTASCVCGAFVLLCAVLCACCPVWLVNCLSLTQPFITITEQQLFAL